MHDLGACVACPSPKQPRPWLTRFPHGELLPQREILQRQLAARANRGEQCPKKDPKPSDHDRPNSRSLRTTQDRCERRVFRMDRGDSHPRRAQKRAQPAPRWGPVCVVSWRRARDSNPQRACAQADFKSQGRGATIGCHWLQPRDKRRPS